MMRYATYAISNGKKGYEYVKAGVIYKIHGFIIKTAYLLLKI